MPAPFFVRDCTLAVIATGVVASTLLELHNMIGTISINSIYHHFWGNRLRPAYIHPEYHNDFSRWASFGLHDYILSERLGILDPTSFSNLEELRKILLDVIEERIDETEFAFWTKREAKFHFLRSVVVVYDTDITFQHPSEMKKVISSLLPTMIFYHFIDARTRTANGMDDFRNWLLSFPEDYSKLIKKIGNIDPYFNTLSEIKNKLVSTLQEFFNE